MDAVKISELVKKLEDDSETSGRELAEIRATMIVNFGPGNRKYSGIVEGHESTLSMIVKVFEYFDYRLEDLGS